MDAQRRPCIEADVPQKGPRHSKRNDLDCGYHLSGFHPHMIAQRRDGNARIMRIDCINTVGIYQKYAILPGVQIDPSGCGAADLHFAGNKHTSDGKCGLILADIALFQARSQNRADTRFLQQGKIEGIENCAFA